MKNSAIRLSVLALAAFGFASSTVVARTSSTNKAPAVVVAATPTPMCMPSKCTGGLD